MGDPIGQTDERRAAENRLWQHGLHEDNVRYQQANIFLVAQSLLAVAYSTIVTAENKNLLAARVMAAFGIAFTMIWLQVGHRHFKYCRAISRRTAAQLPDYAETVATCRPRGRSMPLLVYVLPSLASVMWLILLLIS
ncbi:hypothetical protein ACH5A3_10260 [Streptomyces echinatus]|uniref:hypothetical protein n=1 Tax=Streptomyces echinatus TaxID=67293 RepID=UPI0037955883